STARVACAIKPEHCPLADLQSIGLQAELESALDVRGERLNRFLEYLPGSFTWLYIALFVMSGACVEVVEIKCRDRRLHFVRDLLEVHFSQERTSDALRLFSQVRVSREQTVKHVQSFVGFQVVEYRPLALIAPRGTGGHSFHSGYSSNAPLFSHAPVAASATAHLIP